MLKPVMMPLMAMQRSVNALTLLASTAKFLDCNLMLGNGLTVGRAVRKWFNPENSGFHKMRDGAFGAFELIILLG